MYLYPTVVDGAEDEEILSHTKWRIQNFATAAPAGLELVLNGVSYFNGYDIEGLYADRLYEYSINGGEWTSIDEGTTVFEKVPTGEVSIRYQATETSVASNVVTFDVPMTNPVFTNRNYTPYSHTVSEQFISGMWSTYPNPFEFSKGENGVVTTRVDHVTLLKDVCYKYEFAE